MFYDPKKVILKNGQEAILRSVNEEDALAIIEYMKKISSETDYILRYP